MSMTINPEARVRRLQSALRGAIAVTQEYLDSARLGATNHDGEVDEITKPWCDEMERKLSRWSKALNETVSELVDGV